MEWIKINNPPKVNKDTILFPKGIHRQDSIIKAFYEPLQKVWYNDRGIEISDISEKYSHWLDITPPKDSGLEKLYVSMLSDIYRSKWTYEHLVAFGFEKHKVVVGKAHNYIKGDFRINDAYPYFFYKTEQLPKIEYLDDLLDIYFEKTGEKLK